MTLHTIAIGRAGGVLRGIDPDRDCRPWREVAGPNLPLLERLAKLTGGTAFVAADADALAEVFETIDALEKSPVRGRILTRYDEHYAPWAGFGPGLADSGPDAVAGPAATIAVIDLR